MISAYPTGFKSIEQDFSAMKDTSHSSQPTTSPLLLKRFSLKGKYSNKSLYFLLDHEHVMVIQDYSGAVLIDLKNEKILHRYPFKEKNIASEQISHQDQYLLLQSRGAADLWEIASGKRLQSWRDPDTNAQATAVSHSGKTIFTAQYVHQLQDEKASWEKGPVHTILSVNAHAILSAAAISRDERFLATGGVWDNYVTLWDLHVGKEVISWQMEQHVLTLSFSVENRYLYAGTYVKVVIYDVESKTKVFEIPHFFSVWGSEYLEGQNAILIISREGEIQLCSAPSGKQLWHYQAGQQVEDWNHYPRGDLAVKLSNGEIVVLDLTSGQVRLRFQPPFKWIGPLDVSKDGNRLAVVTYPDEETWGVALWQLPEKGDAGRK